MGLVAKIARLFTWWNGQTLNTQLHTWRKGERVGEDDAGNVFYQSDAGKRRWVIFNGENDPSKIGPEWHGWLHYTFDEPPTKQPLAHKSWEKPHQPNMTGTELAYAPSGSIRRPEPASRADYEAWSPE